MKKTLTVIVAVMFTAVSVFAGSNKNYPRVDTSDFKPIEYDGGVIQTGYQQDANGDLVYTYRLPHSKEEIIKFAGNLHNYIEVVKGICVASINDLVESMPDHVEIRLFTKHKKTWHYLYYDRNGKFIGKFGIDKSILDEDFIDH
jgi:hypothetical protein